MAVITADAILPVYPVFTRAMWRFGQYVKQQREFSGGEKAVGQAESGNTGPRSLYIVTDGDERP